MADSWGAGHCCELPVATAAPWGPGQELLPPPPKAKSCHSVGPTSTLTTLSGSFNSSPVGLRFAKCIPTPGPLHKPFPLPGTS